MKLLQSQSCEQLFKAVHIKVFHPGNKRHALQVHRAPHGRGINAHGIDVLLANTAEKIEKTWPGQEYSLVPIGPTTFNFVWRSPGETLVGKTWPGYEAIQA